MKAKKPVKGLQAYTPVNKTKTGTKKAKAKIC